MPYVTEKSEFSQTNFPYGNGASTAFLRYGTERAQYGYRSGVPTRDPSAGMPTITHGPTSKRVLEYLGNSEAYFTGARSDGWAEHDRTYSETNISHPTTIGFTARRKSAPAGTGFIHHNAIVCVGWNAVPQLELPPAREESRIAESLIRATVPDRPYTNVTRTLGELRDAPQLLAVANYAPRNTGQIGGAYLNQVFGAQPTVGDMQRLGEAVHRVIPAIRDEIADCSRIIRTQKSMQYAHRSGTVTTTIATSASPSYHGSLANGRYAVYGMRGGGDILLRGGISFSETVDVRAYGRYGRTIVRMDSMNRSLGSKLKPLLGSGLSADVIYDLTPYSWLLNWVWDFGSVLRYQESLNGADVVAYNHGYNVRRILRSACTYSFEENPDGSLFELVTSRGDSCTITRRSDRRVGGVSPYSLTRNSWDSLSGSQWAILAALGLARAPGVPIIRDTSRSAIHRDHRASRRAGARNRHGI